MLRNHFVIFNRMNRFRAGCDRSRVANLDRERRGARLRDKPAPLVLVVGRNSPEAKLPTVAGGTFALPIYRSATAKGASGSSSADMNGRSAMRRYHAAQRSGPAPLRGRIPPGNTSEHLPRSGRSRWRSAQNGVCAGIVRIADRHVGAGLDHPNARQPATRSANTKCKWPCRRPNTGQ
jgi:hypothetical protein